MTTVKVEETNGKTNNFIDSRYEVREDKIVILHDERDKKMGGVNHIIQRVYDKAEVKSVSYC